MSVNEAFESAYDALYNRTSEVLPIYLVGISSVAVIRVAPFVSLAMLYLVLAYHGRTEELAEVLGDVDLEGFADPETVEPGAGEPLTEAFDLVFSTPGVVPVLVGSFVSLILLAIVVNALVGAGRVHTVYSAIKGEEPLHDGVEGALEDYAAFVLLALIELLAVLGVTSFLMLLGGFVALHASGAAAVALGVVLALVWVLLVLVVHLFFLFAPQSVVVDGVGAVDGIRGNYGFLKREPADFLAYLVVAVGGFLLLGTLAGAFGAMGADAMVPLFAYLGLIPALDLVKTDLYARHAGELPIQVNDEDVGEGKKGAEILAGEQRQGQGEKEAAGSTATYGEGEEDGGRGYTQVLGTTGDDLDRQTRSYSEVGPGKPGGGGDGWREPASRIREEVRRGWGEMVEFSFERWRLVVLSAFLFGAAFAGGMRFAEIYLGGFETSIEARLEHVSPVGGFLNYASNNWTVAVASSYSGLAFGVPTVLAVAFNGLMLGGLAATEVDPVSLLAFVVPHGVVEIPALLISAALGLYLGMVAWGFLRGKVDVEAVVSEVERAYYVLLGLAVLFVFAGFVEAFVSPYYTALLPL